MRVKPGGKKSAKYRSSLVGTHESNSKWYLDWFSHLAQLMVVTDTHTPLSTGHLSSVRDRPKFGFGYGVSAETTQKYGFGLVSVTAKRNGRITVSAET